MQRVFFLLGCILLFFTCEAQTKDALKKDLASFIQHKGDSLLRAGKLPGIFAGVLNKGERQYFNFGYAMPDEKVPFDSASLFEAGSITKTFTAFIVESILHEKRIADSTSVVSYLPDSVQKNEALGSITFLSLLNHTSGLPRLPDNISLEGLAPYDNYTVDDLFSYLKLATPMPDGKSNYSNLGIGLAGVLAQRMTGKDYNALLSEFVFKPFEIQNSSTRKSQGYLNGQKVAFWNMNVLAPAGSLHSTAHDLLTYLEYMSKPKGENEKRIIDKLLQPTASLSPVVKIGKAWHTIETKGKPTIYWHNGGTYGFSTFAAFVKDTGQAVIVVVNQFNANATSDGLGIAIMRKMLE